MFFRFLNRKVNLTYYFFMCLNVQFSFFDMTTPNMPLEEFVEFLQTKGKKDLLVRHV